MTITKCGSRGAAHAAISLRWSVKCLLACLYKGNQSLIVSLTLGLDPPLITFRDIGKYNTFQVLYEL